MVFGILGSPIYENFQDTPNGYNNDNDNNGNNNNVDYKTCIKRCDKTEELNGMSEEAEEESTTTEVEAEEESTTTAVEEEEESTTTAVEEEEVEDEEEEDEEEVEDEEESTTTAVEEEDESGIEESFSGSMNVEHFSGKNVTEKVLSLNLLLKSILFACLFYIIAHPDTKVFLLQNLKFLKKSDYLMISMVLFFICYYILSIFV